MLVPPAKQVVVLGQLTALRMAETPNVWLVQVLPPSVVAKIRFGPTAKQVVALGQLIPSKAKVEYWFSHVVPPLVVAKIPPSPTAQQSLVLTHATRYRRLPLIVVWALVYEYMRG
jgi:hypothetical protein